MEEKHFIIACIDKSSSARLSTYTQIYCEYSELWTRAALIVVNIAKRRVELCCVSCSWTCSVLVEDYQYSITLILYLAHKNLDSLYVSGMFAFEKFFSSHGPSLRRKTGHIKFSRKVDGGNLVKPHF